MRIEEVDEEKGLASEQKIQQLQSIISSLSQRNSRAKCNNVKNTLAHPITIVFSSLFITVSGCFAIAYAITSKNFNHKMESCPDFLKQCDKLALNDELISCSTKLVKKLCNSQKEVEIDFKNTMISTELLVEFALLIALISFYQYCSTNARLDPIEATEIMQLTGEDLSASHNPVKKMKELISQIEREGYRDNALFQQPEAVTPLLEPEQRKGCLRNFFGH